MDPSIRDRFIEILTERETIYLTSELVDYSTSIYQTVINLAISQWPGEIFNQPTYLLFQLQQI